MVKVDNSLSPTIVLNTGAPQGCVFRPFIYTNDCQSPFTTIPIILHMQMTAILALFKNSDNDSFFNHQHSITDF